MYANKLEHPKVKSDFGQPIAFAAAQLLISHPASHFPSVAGLLSNTSRSLKERRFESDMQARLHTRTSHQLKHPSSQHISNQQEQNEKLTLNIVVVSWVPDDRKCTTRRQCHIAQSLLVASILRSHIPRIHMPESRPAIPVRNALLAGVIHDEVLLQVGAVDDLAGLEFAGVAGEAQGVVVGA